MCFGVLGYPMVKFRFSPAGTLLGLILGPVAESGLRNLLIVSKGTPVAFALQRPISVAILLITAAVVWSSSRPRSREAREMDVAGKRSDD